MRRPMLLLAAPLMLVVAKPGLCDWPTVPSETVQIQAESRSVRSISDAAGGAYFVTAGPTVRVTHLDAAGNVAPGWTADGVQISPDEGEDFDAIADGQGGVIVAWSSGGHVRLQHIASDASVVTGWPAAGWDLSAGENVRLALDGSGGAYLVWQDAGAITNSGFSRVTHVQGDGTLATGWFANGRIVTSGRYRVVPVPDATGGCFLVYDTGSTTVVEHRNAAGSVDGQWSSDPYTRRTWVLACGDGDGGVVVAVAHNPADFVYETWMIRISSDGTVVPGWLHQGAWLTLPDAWAHRLFLDAQGDVVVTWFTGSGAARVGRRVLDGTAAPGWPAGGAELPGASGTPGEQNDAVDVISDGAGGLLYSWLSDQVHAGRIDATGQYAATWPQGGILLDTAIDGRAYLGLVPDAVGGAIASWRGSSTSSPTPAEANHFNADGTLGPAASVGVVPSAAPAAFRFAPPHPNPARAAVTLTIELPRASQVSIAVFDPQGRLVQRLASGTLPIGVHEVPWDLTNRSGARVRPGVYLIHAATPRGTMTRRLVVAE